MGQEHRRTRSCLNSAHTHQSTPTHTHTNAHTRTHKHKGARASTPTPTNGKTYRSRGVGGDAAASEQKARHPRLPCVDGRQQRALPPTFRLQG